MPDQHADQHGDQLRDQHREQHRDLHGDQSIAQQDKHRIGWCTFVCDCVFLPVGMGTTVASLVLWWREFVTVQVAMGDHVSVLAAAALSMLVFVVAAKSLYNQAGASEDYIFLLIPVWWNLPLSAFCPMFAQWPIFGAHPWWSLILLNGTWFLLLGLFFVSIALRAAANRKPNIWILLISSSVAVRWLWLFGPAVHRYCAMQGRDILIGSPFPASCIFLLGALNARTTTGREHVVWWPSWVSWACVACYTAVLYPWPFASLHVPYKLNSEATAGSMHWWYSAIEVAVLATIGMVTIVAFVVLLIYRVYIGYRISLLSFCNRAKKVFLVLMLVASLLVIAIVKVFEYSVLWASILPAASLALEVMRRCSSAAVDAQEPAAQPDPEPDPTVDLQSPDCNNPTTTNLAFSAYLASFAIRFGGKAEEQTNLEAGNVQDRRHRCSAISRAKEWIGTQTAWVLLRFNDTPNGFNASTWAEVNAAEVNAEPWAWESLSSDAQQGAPTGSSFLYAPLQNRERVREHLHSKIKESTPDASVSLIVPPSVLYCAPWRAYPVLHGFIHFAEPEINYPQRSQSVGA